MTPLLLLGAALFLGMAASKAKAQPPQPSPPEPISQPKTQITITKPKAAKKQKAKAAIAKKIEKKARIKKLEAIAKSARARAALKRLVTIAANKKLPAPTRKKALAKVEKIVAKPKTIATASPAKLPTAAKIAIASAITKADQTTKPTADQAAKILKIWTWGGGNQGTRRNRSATVTRCQKLMGLKADGIIGPGTRARAKALGYTLAPRSKQKPGAVGYATELQFNV